MQYRFTTICVVGLLVLSGCTTPITSGTNSTPDPIELPEKPQPLNNQTVKTFAESNEEAVLYNDRLSSHPTENNLACRGSIGTETETGYLVFVQCTGGIQFEGGEHEDVATWSLYYVDSETTKRSSVRNADVRNMESKDGSQHPYSGFQIANFNSTTRDISVVLAPNGSKSNVTLSYRLGPNESVIQNNLPIETKIPIKMDVRTSTETATFTCSFEKPATRLGHGMIVSVFPDGQIVLVRLPPRLD